MSCTYTPVEVKGYAIIFPHAYRHKQAYQLTGRHTTHTLVVQKLLIPLGPTKTDKVPCMFVVAVTGQYMYIVRSAY